MNLGHPQGPGLHRLLPRARIPVVGFPASLSSGEKSDGHFLRRFRKKSAHCTLTADTKYSPIPLILATVRREISLAVFVSSPRFSALPPLPLHRLQPLRMGYSMSEWITDLQTGASVLAEKEARIRGDRGKRKEPSPQANNRMGWLSYLRVLTP